MTHVATARLSLQASIETSRNTLRSDNRLKENGVDVVLPEARTQVSENRREAAAGVTWRPNDQWALEGSMRHLADHFGPRPTRVCSGIDNQAFKQWLADTVHLWDGRVR